MTREGGSGFGAVGLRERTLGEKIYESLRSVIRGSEARQRVTELAQQLNVSTTLKSFFDD